MGQYGWQEVARSHRQQAQIAADNACQNSVAGGDPMSQSNSTLVAANAGQGWISSERPV